MSRLGAAVPRDLVLIAVLGALLALAPSAVGDFRLGLLAKFLCLAMVAVGIGLAWGQGGMLTMGQGVFFGIGAYLMGMHLKLADAGPGGVPDVLLYSGLGSVPAWWEPLRSPVVTIALIVLLPTALAALLGLGVFRRSVRGAYFAILSQALVAAFAIFLIGQQTLGGSNGLSGFRSFLGYDLADPINRELLYYISAATLVGMVLIVRQLMRSRFGELLVAVRDQEHRVRFLGYDPATVKIITFALAALFASIGGALFVPVVGMISPADVGVVPSIGFLVGVAIGGRATLLGPAVGAVAIAWAQTTLSEQLPSAWTYVQGALFVLVIAFLPGGLSTIGGLRRRAVGEESGVDPGRGEGGVPPAPSTLASDDPADPAERTEARA